MCFIEFPKACRVPRELGELWNVEYELMEEGYPDRVKQRGIDPGFRATRSSDYSLTPWNSKRVRAGMTMPVGGGGRRFPYRDEITEIRIQ